MATTDSRFGTIQLSDSDEDAGHRKQKKKKDKKAKRVDAASMFDPMAFENRLSLDGDMLATTHQLIQHVDDDDDEDVGPSLALKKKGASKVFSGLARVDLTTPLREDEFIPEPKHRVVPVRKPEAKPAKSGKKAKKNKDAKKKNTDSLEVADLLDLSGFTQAQLQPARMLFGSDVQASAATQFTSTPIAPSSTNPINTAFDDLFGLSATATPQLLNPIDALQKPASRHRPRMRASLKISSVSGPPTVDWAQVSLTYQVYRKSSDVKIVFRVENHNSVDLLGLSMMVKDHSENVRLGDIARGSLKETEKLGPFICGDEASNEYKGVLSTASGSCISFKFSVPACVFLNPQKEVSLEQISRELTSSQWFSFSSKVEILRSTSPKDAFSIIAAFLRAAEVEGGTQQAATFAARSDLGTCVRVLAKVKGQTVKIDIKSTSASLGKDIASDIKRLML